MKRRKFGLLAGTSMVAFAAPVARSFASGNAALLTTTLTPLGGERAGNAAGTIPAWTGGLTAVPAGVTWDPEKTLPPDFYASDAMLYEVNASNMAQYKSLLSDGLQALIQKTGYTVKVYPTRRTAAAPQAVYDDITANVTRAVPEAGGIRLGFNGALGGVPFPIPDSDPMVAGGQIVYNHEARWEGKYKSFCVCGYSAPNGQPTLVQGSRGSFKNSYYIATSESNFDGYFAITGSTFIAPSTLIGNEIVSKNSTNILKYPQDTWQLLQGQGRVRKTPNVEYDTPASSAYGIINYDEYFGFTGPLNRYDWKSLGKQEMLIPYNNNKIFSVNSKAAHLPKFFDPEITRWELHRVWVVEGTLHPGERNIMARRKLYIDEDTWIIGITDTFDGGGSLYHHTYNFNANFPNLPGTIFQNSVAYNIQTGDYVSLQGAYADSPFNAPWTFNSVPDAVFQPQTMAAGSSY